MSATYNCFDAHTSLPVCPKFLADSDGHATSFAQSLATMWNRPISLYKDAVSVPFIAVYNPGSNQVTPASVNVVF